MQIQLEKEKLGYDLESIQSQLDKALGQSARIQKEKEQAQLEADRLRDKSEKLQVSAVKRQKKKQCCHILRHRPQSVDYKWKRTSSRTSARN